MKIRQFAVCVMGSFAFGLAGCAGITESYVGEDRDQVWTAMVAAAESPTYYPDWIMTENNVWVDDANARIEIDRELRRDIVLPRMKHAREERDIHISVYLLEDEFGDPIVECTPRNFAIPAKSADEAQWYFDEVWEYLGGRPMPVRERAASTHDDHDTDRDGYTREREAGIHDADRGAHETRDDDGLIDVDDL